MERARVVALAALCEPIDMLITLVDEVCNKESVSLEVELEQARADLPSHEYSRFYNAKVREVVNKLWIQRQRRGNASSSAFETQLLSESDAIVRIIIQWVNHTSRECTNAIEPTSLKPLDDYLSPHEQVYDILQLRNGRTLSRVVVSLIFHAVERLGGGSVQQQQQTKNTIKAEGKAGSGAVATVSTVKGGLTLEELRSYAAVENDEEGLVRLSLQHAALYLGVPLFRVEDVANGNRDVIHSLVGYLLLCTPQTKSLEDAKECESFQSQCEAIKFSFQQVEERIRGVKTVVDVQTAWKNVQTGGAFRRVSTLAAATVSAATVGGSGSTPRDNRDDAYKSRRSSDSEWGGGIGSPNRKSSILGSTKSSTAAVPGLSGLPPLSSDAGALNNNSLSSARRGSNNSTDINLAKKRVRTLLLYYLLAVI
jgi:hypothetical protein